MLLATMPLESRTDDLAHAFSERARINPTAIALFDRERSVTYAALEARSWELARGLARRGVVAGDHVGLALPRSIDLVATMLAGFWIGAVIVPIDPAWPAARRAVIERDAELVWTVTSVTELDISGESPAPAAHPIALALYTSGSTGEPKAVLLGHAALLWRCRALASAMPYEAADVACHRTQPTFVDAYAEIFGPLLHGTPAFVMPHPFAIADLVAALESARITRLLLVPSVLAIVLDACADLGARAPALRLIATSGEPLPETLARRCVPRCRAQLVNICSSTGVAGDAHVWEDPSRSAPARRRDAPDRRDRGGVAPSVVGDCGEWAGARRGLLERPELTAARFVARVTRGVPPAISRAAPGGRLALAGRSTIE
jgi:acyl-coenzyme A synthetase/AMP-(fatty) acid ligase